MIRAPVFADKWIEVRTDERDGKDVEGGIHLHFRPELPEQTVLECRVREHGMSEVEGIGGGNADAERTLNVKVMPAFAKGNRGRDYSVTAAVSIAAGRNGCPKEKRQNVGSRSPRWRRAPDI